MVNFSCRECSLEGLSSIIFDINIVIWEFFGDELLGSKIGSR